MEKGNGIEPKRIVLLFFMGSTVFLGMFLEKILGIVFSYARWNDVAVFGEGWTVTTLVGFGIAVATAIVCWKNARVQALALDIASELKKVTWPTFQETRVATVAVIAATFVAAMLFFLFDSIWARLGELVY